jgi:ATP-dependent DNA helicase RecG
VLNNHAEKSFELTLLREPLLSDNQKRFQKELGVHLSGHEAEVFSFACREERITITDARGVAGLSTSEASALLDRLAVQQLIEPLEDGKLYALVSHLRQRYLATLPQEKAESRQTEGRVEAESLETKVLKDIKTGAKGKADIAESVGKKAVDGQLNSVGRELMDSGLIEHTLPKKPQSRPQKYRLTESGQRSLETCGQQEKG